MVSGTRVRDAMSTEVLEIPEDATLLAAAARMAMARVNSLVVRPEAKEDPYGIVTSTDIVDALADGLDLEETKVGEVATAPLVFVTPNLPLEYAARLMRRTNLRHLAVFNGKSVVGVLSSFDVAKAIVRSRVPARGTEWESSGRRPCARSARIAARRPRFQREPEVFSVGPRSPARGEQSDGATRAGLRISEPGQENP